MYCCVYYIKMRSCVRSSVAAVSFREETTGDLRTCENVKWIGTRECVAAILRMS